MHSEQAERLAEITQRVGLTLWQLQELESMAATFFVLLASAKFGMGTEAGETLIASAKGRTFGATITQLKASGLLSGELEARFRRLLYERNWLVHNSRSDSRAAVYSGSAFGVLLLRLDRIAEEALGLLRDLGSRAEKHVMAYGVMPQQIDAEAATLLKAWREADAI